MLHTGSLHESHAQLQTEAQIIDVTEAQDNDETEASEPQTQSTQGQPSLAQQKMNAILNLMHELGISLGEFLYQLFLFYDSQGRKVERTRRHCAFVQEV